MPATKKKTASKTSAKKASARRTSSGKATGGKKGAGKAAGRKTTASKKGRGGSANPAFMKPMQPDAELAAIVGAKPISRTEITKKVWDYVKSHNLQDEENRRIINADEKLQPLFGGKKRVSMFEITRLVNQHIK